MILLENQTLYNTLKELNVVQSKKLEEAFKMAGAKKPNFAEYLITHDLISDENLGKVISELIKVPFIRLANEDIAEDVLRVIPEIYARRHKAIVFKKDKNGLKLAMSNPLNTEISDFISKKSGDKVNIYFATDRDIEDALNLYSKDLTQTFDELIKSTALEADKSKEKEVPIAKLIDMLVSYAYQNKASDIHVEPEEDISVIRFRVDGVLHDVLTLPKNLHDQVISRIKVLSRLRTDEHMSAQDGKMQVPLEKEDLDIRVSVVPVVEGEKAVLRLLSSRSRQFGLEGLGMGGEELKKVTEAFSKPHGMILSTGPTGSGKTTTIYAILKILNSRDINIATIEDPVEYDLEGINQIQVNPKTNLTFADGLRSILRQDPDIIFVGEIRDKETAGIAVNSAMTGHLVLSTLHTNDAATTLPRLIDMDIEPFLVASTVNAIVGQRLVRKICQSCRVSEEIERKALSQKLPTAVVEKHFGLRGRVRLYKGKGCEVCHNTGYAGRIGIFEVLIVSPTIRDLINAKASSDKILEEAKKLGMTTMFDDGLEKVARGLTTIEEIFRVTKD